MRRITNFNDDYFLKMIEFLILICFAQNYPETKSLSDGVFIWPHALAISRKIWKWLKIPSISFNFTDINLTQISKQYITDNINFNINDEIKEMLSEINDTYMRKSFIKNKRKLPKSYTKCNSEEYPNVYFIFGGDPGDYDCQTVENTLGQIFSYLLMVIPLFVITIISLLMYFVFSFGRCFCFKPKSNIKPNLFEIISFSVIGFILLYSILINFSGSIYFVTKVKYLLNKDIENDFTEICQSFGPSIKTELRKMIDQLDPIFDEIIEKVTKFVNKSVPIFYDLINKTVEESNVYIDVFKNVDDFGNKYKISLQKVENLYEICANEFSNDSSTCPNETSLLKNIKFNKGLQELQDFKEKAIYFVKMLNVPDYIDEAHQDLIESISNMKEDLKKEIDPNKFEFFNNTNCNINEIFDVLDNVPSFVVPLMTFILILAPILMLVTFASQIYSFWFPGKFSRACSFMCVPCSFCMIFHFVVGSIGTILAFFVIIYNIVYNNGDEMIDTVLKKVTNEDRIIHFGELNLLSVTDDAIGTFLIEDIKLKKIEIIKNLLDANVKSTLSDILNVDKLPIKETAQMIEKTMDNLASAIKFDKYIVYDLIEEIDKLIKAAPPSDLSNIASIYDLKARLNYFKISVTCCDNEKTSVIDNYNSFINDFYDQISIYSNSFNTFKYQTRNIPNEIADIATELLIGLLELGGPALSTALNEISPILGSFDMSWVIGSFNLIRSKFLHPFWLGCIYLSISAHLYVISMALFSMLLWYRRRGMSDAEYYDNINSDSNESGSASVFTNLIT